MAASPTKLRYQHYSRAQNCRMTKHSQITISAEKHLCVQHPRARKVLSSQKLYENIILVPNDRNIMTETFEAIMLNNLSFSCGMWNGHIFEASKNYAGCTVFFLKFIWTIAVHNHLNILYIFTAICIVALILLSFDKKQKHCFLYVSKVK